MDLNVMIDYECDTGWNVEEDGYKWIQIGFDCLSDLDTNVNDG